jgi:8-oxo-dGTP pyrophosphatase MutT (NUDIX family)
MFNNPKFPPSSPWDYRLKNPELTLSPVKKLHENDYFSVYDRGSYFTVEPAFVPVVILPVLEDNSMIFVRVKRPVIGDSPLELPSGGLDIGETAEKAALREVREETGIQIFDTDRLVPLPPLSSSPNRNPFLIYCFGVKILEEEWNRRLDHDNEIDSVERLSLMDVTDRIISGEIYITLHISIASAFILSQLKEQGKFQ